MPQISLEEDIHRDSASDDNAKTHVILTAHLHPACVPDLNIVLTVLPTVLNWQDPKIGYVP